MLFVLGVIRGDDDDRPGFHLSIGINYVTSHLGSLPTFPLQSFARSPPTTMIALAPRGRVVPCCPGGNHGGKHRRGGRGGKSINQNNTALASRQSRGRSSAKGLTFDIPIIFHLDIDVSSSSHHSIIPSIWLFRLWIFRIDTHALSHTLFS